LYEYDGDIPPAELEDAYYAQHRAQPAAELPNQQVPGHPGAAHTTPLTLPREPSCPPTYHHHRRVTTDTRPTENETAQRRTDPTLDPLKPCEGVDRLLLEANDGLSARDRPLGLRFRPMTLETLQRNFAVEKSVVAVTAFACDPNIPSEPTIGWEFLRSIISAATDEGNLDVVAFMNKRSKIATERRLAELGVREHISIVGVELPAILRLLKNPYLTRLEYLVWSQQTKHRLRQLHNARGIVLARHVTFASELLPTPISGLHGKCRTVWGPVGSLGQAQAVLVEPRHARWRSQFVLQRIRDVVSRIQSRKISRSVDSVLTTSRELAGVVERVGTHAIVFPNVVLDEELISTIAELRVSYKREQSSYPDLPLKPLTILCVGNLVYLKRFEIAISALRDPALATARLVIVGKPAPGRDNYLAPIAARLGVSERVSFVGQLPRIEVIRLMFSADVLFHPSSREGGSGVIGEATAVGIPVVCFAGTGSANVLDDAGTSGTKISAGGGLTCAQVAAAITQAAELPRNHTSIWGRDRLNKLESSLLRQALREQSDL